MGDQGSPDPVGRIRLTVFENGDISVTTKHSNGTISSSATYETRFDVLQALISDLRYIDTAQGPLFSHEYRQDTDAGDLRPQEPPKPPPEQKDRG